MIKQIKKLILPFYIRFIHIRRIIVAEWLIVWAHWRDMMRYRKYSFRYTSLDRNFDNISSALIMDSHAIEKGLSLPEIRSGYGELRVRRVLDLLDRYQRKGFPAEELAVRKAKAVLTEYVNYHKSIGYDLGEIGLLIEPLLQEDCTAGGYFFKRRDELLEGARGDFAACALSRYSVRTYSGEPVDEALVKRAVEIARKTPSVCNRQAWHVYAVRTPELKSRVLELQSGNRGFGDRADCLLIITSDIRAFFSAEERNESFVDGGLFSMSLMYALHYNGLGVCPLNWMVLPGKDAKMRDLLNIKPSENIIMIMAVGNLPDEVRVAKSVRHDVEDLLTIL